MVSGVSDSSYTTQYVSQTSSSSSTEELTEEEKTTLEAILENYDAEEMSEEEFEALMQEIEDADISASEDLKDYLEAAGFKPSEPPEEAPVEESESEGSSKVQELLDQLEAGEITQEEFDAMVADMESAGESTQGNLVDEKV